MVISSQHPNSSARKHLSSELIESSVDHLSSSSPAFGHGLSGTWTLVYFDHVDPAFETGLNDSSEVDTETVEQ